MNGTDINEQEVIKLRRKGYSFQKIADTLGLANRGSAYNIFKRVMERDYALTQEEVETYRAEELARLEEIHHKLMDYIDESRGGLQIVDRILKVMDRKAKLLGLDAPTRTETKVDMSLSHEQALLELDREDLSNGVPMTYDITSDDEE